MSMVNGRPFEECVAELKAMRPPQEPKGSTGYWYYPIEAFNEAMDAVFGIGHYNLAFSEPIYRAIGSGQEMVTVRCTLTIVDDDGQPVKRVDGFGDKEVFYDKNSHRADVGNLTSSTAALAFKDACKYLGIFGYRTNAGRQEKAQSGKKKNTSGSAGKEKKPEEALNLIVTDKFYQQGENKGQPVWKLPIKKNEGNKPGEAGEVVFYHNQTEKVAGRFNELIAFVANGLDKGKGRVTLRLMVTPSGEYNGLPQYVFKDFADRG